MNSKIIAIVIGAVLLAFLLIFSMTYSVRFNEMAIVTTFGEPSEVNQEPGLHFKWPAPIQSKKLYDSRVQMVETRLETHATRDGLQVITQAFVFWRIDPDRVLEFERAYGSVDTASDDIEARMRSAGGAISEFGFEELIGEGNKLAEVEAGIHDRLVESGSGSRKLAELGVQIERVGLSQLMLPVETTKKVVERMKKEKDERAEGIRTEGEAAAQRVRSEAQQKAQTILDHADRLAAKIRAQGDMLSNEAVAVMNEDAEFASFLMWLDALEQTTGGASTFFIPTTFAPFHLLDPESMTSGGIPQPEQGLPSIPDAGRANRDLEGRLLAENQDDPSDDSE